MPNSSIVPFLKRVLATIAALALIACVILYWAIFTRVSNAGLSFENPLAIPPEMKFEGTVPGVKRFELVVQRGETQFIQGQNAATMGVNGSYLGPTIRARKGDRVILDVRNQLGEDTTMHWHGMEVPAIMDGTPHQTIKPGSSWTAEYDIVQEAATVWYHPHTHGNTARQVYQGIAGLFIIDDKNSQSLDLPDTYGVDDIPLVIQDREFNSDGTLRYRVRSGGNYGEEILVNGTHNPHLAVESRPVRFRILNGSNARIYWFGFEDQRKFLQIATDGGLLESPVEADRVRLSPGERAEIVVDFTDGLPATLQSFPEAPLFETIGAWFGGITNGYFDIIRFEPKESTRDPHRIPQKLNTIERWTVEQSANTRSMNLGPMLINGKSMDMRRIDERVRLGDIEVWRIRNFVGRPHPFHVHLVQFLVLDRDGKPPSPQESGWKDTVLVEPGETVNAIMKFARYADANTPYMYHCHILEHEDMGMMGQFVVEER